MAFSTAQETLTQRTGQVS